MKRIIYFLLVFGLLYPTLSVSGSVDKSLVPGSSAKLELTVSNPGNDEITGVSIEVYGSQYFIYNSKYSVGDMAPGTSTTINIPIKAKKDAKSGVYTFDIKVYGYTSSGTESNLNYKASSIAVYVVNKPKFIIKYGHINKEGLFNFSINNNGGPAEDVEISFMPSIVGEDSIFVNNIDDSYSGLVRFDTDDFESGKNLLVMKISYLDEIGNSNTIYKNLSVIVDKEDFDLLFKQLSNITTNKNSILELSIKNNGYDLKDVKIYFDNISLINKKEIVLGDIKKGETKQIKEQVYTSLRPGVNIIKCYIKYYKNGAEKLEVEDIPIYILKDNKVNIFIDSSDLPIVYGKESVLTITVANIGSYDITSVVVSLNDSNNLQILNIENSQFIGTLSKDDFSSVNYKIKLFDNANMTVLVKYKDMSGNWFTTKKTFHLRGVAEKQEGSILPFVIILVIIIGAVYYYYKMRK